MAGKIQKQEACSEALPNYTDLSFRERGLVGPRSSLTGHMQIELLQEECLGVFLGILQKEAGHEECVWAIMGNIVCLEYGM